MRLATFITHNHAQILQAWVEFARTQTPAAQDLDDVALEDHGKKILEELVRNMETPQDEDERRTKSEGNSQLASTSPRVPSRSHARQRERQGFEMGQMVAEYRALRATVLRLWQASDYQAQLQDIDDVIRFNEAVDQALAESVEVFIAELNKARDLFLGVLGHDLRGPLSTIAGAATVELRKWPDEVRHAPVILRSVAQMKALLDDLMEFTTYRLGKGLSLSPTNMQLDQFARNTLDEIDAISSERELILKSRGDLSGEWDPRRLHQALSNLVFNALKYGFPSSPVWVELDGTGDDVLLTVRNTGKPIEAALLPKLFDPLVRDESRDESKSADSSAQVAGANLGLGLYVVREIATAHGGTVEVTSDASATEFTLRLPRVAIPADQAPIDT